MTISTTTIKNKTATIKKDAYGYFEAIITQDSDINSGGEILSMKSNLKTLAGINRWVKKEMA